MMGMLDDGYFSDSTERDFFRLFCGERLGSGMSREVWSFGLDDKFVIKFERRGMFQNVVEWNTWHDAIAMGDEPKKWLAPCDRISDNGRVLIQRRTKPAKKFPDKMPAFLCDFKKTNYGMIGNQLVCHDYGTNVMCNWGLTKRMLKVPHWYDE